MSSILKALKKLEAEQAGRTEGASSGRSGGQFFAPAPTGRHPWLLLACGIGVGLLLAGGGYYLLAGRPVPTQPESTVPIKAAAPSAPSASAMPASPPGRQDPAPSAASPPTASGLSPANAVVSKAMPTVASAGSAAKVKPLETTTAAPAAQRPAVPATPPAARPKPESQDAQPVVAPPLPKAAPVAQVQVERREIPAPGQQWMTSHLVVSDILPASGGGRMAIVNGLPVMEGTMVEDAVVREIHPGQVIFEIGGKSVAVPLTTRP